MPRPMLKPAQTQVQSNNLLSTTRQENQQQTQQMDT